MEGAIAALRESGRAHEVMLVVNELTDESREALQDGTVKIVIGTPLRQLCAELIPLMIHTVEKGMAETPGQRFLPFEIWTPESLCDDVIPSDRVWQFTSGMMACRGSLRS